MQGPVEGRIFLVGCPRSGTTLLQSLLAAHPLVASFPESHFFSRTVVLKNESWHRRLGLASPKARPQFNKFLNAIGHDEMQKFLPRTALFASQYTQAFIRALDTMTKLQGKSFWLEKSPEHVRYIEHIEKWVSAPKFIHILRNGADVVASLYEVTHQYPEVWHGSWDINKCIRQWIKDVRISNSYLHKSNHMLVRYEQLVEDPQSVLIELCKFLDITFDAIMLQEYRAAAKKVTRKWEVWKESVGEPIRTANCKKFYKLFSEEQRQYILTQLAVVDTEILSVDQLVAKK